MTQGVLLAAGASRRYGGCKLLQAHIAGRPMAAVAAEHLLQALPAPLAVVADDRSPLAELLQALGLRTVVNPDPGRGMASSIAVAVAASRGRDGWVIALADMPWIQPATIAAVAAALRAGAPAAAPAYGGRRGHPVGFGRACAAQLVALRGSSGAKALFQQLPGARVLPTDDPGVLRDVDRPGDLASGWDSLDRDQ